MIFDEDDRSVNLSETMIMLGTGYARVTLFDFDRYDRRSQVAFDPGMLRVWINGSELDRSEIYPTFDGPTFKVKVDDRVEVRVVGLWEHPADLELSLRFISSWRYMQDLEYMLTTLLQSLGVKTV